MRYFVVVVSEFSQDSSCQLSHNEVQKDLLTFLSLAKMEQLFLLLFFLSFFQRLAGTKACFLLYYGLHDYLSKGPYSPLVHLVSELCVGLNSVFLKSVCFYFCFPLLSYIANLWESAEIQSQLARGAFYFQTLIKFSLSFLPYEST